MTPKYRRSSTKEVAGHETQKDGFTQGLFDGSAGHVEEGRVHTGLGTGQFQASPGGPGGHPV
jgi:hypothetical protein